MSYRIRFTDEARTDIRRLYAFVLDASGGNWWYAERSVEAIETAIAMLADSPFAGRKTGDEAMRRELVIGFGNAGFVALYEVEGGEIVTVAAVRHQREDDYR